MRSLGMPLQKDDLSLLGQVPPTTSQQTSTVSTESHITWYKLILVHSNTGARTLTAAAAYALSVVYNSALMHYAKVPYYPGYPALCGMLSRKSPTVPHLTFDLKPVWSQLNPTCSYFRFLHMEFR
jgi:hypothetical protein